MDYVRSYFINPKYTQLMQLIVSFALGVTFSPYSYGFIFLLLYLFVYEAIYLFFTRACTPYWTPLFRGSIIAISIYGWIIGRVIVGWRNPFRSDPNDP